MSVVVPTDNHPVIINYKLFIMSRGLKNNNPGNVRHDGTKWQGEIIPSQDASFKQFSSMAYGYRCMIKLLQNYSKLHGCNTVHKMINRYAPPIENHTDNYIRVVCDRANIQPDAEVAINNKDEMCRIVAAMSYVENGVPAVMPNVMAGWELL